MRVVVASLVFGLLGGAIGAGVGAVVIHNQRAAETEGLRADIAALHTELAAMRAELAAPKAPPAPQVPPAPPAPPAAPSATRIHITSTPPGADVTDVDGRVFGRTPIEMMTPSGRTPRTFTLRLRGYRSQSVELVPDHDVDYAATLAKSAAAEPAVRTTVGPRPDCDIFTSPHGCSR